MHGIATEKKSLPWWRRILLGLVLAVIGLIIAFMLACYIVQKQLGAEIIKINQAGEPITFLDLQAELSPPVTGEDAAPYYT